jgi:6-phosphogluconolactonase
MNSVEIRKAINAADVASKASDEIIEDLRGVIATKGIAHLALTGGTVGILTLEVLAKKVSSSGIDFSKVHFWWGDERFVDSTSSDRNANQARIALLDSLNLASSNVHEFPAADNGLDLNSAREAFAAHLLNAFGTEKPKMDITILGMGPDGHVASLFPGHEHNDQFVVAENNSPKPPAERLTMSMNLINSSDKVIFVVSGLDKAQAVESVHKDPDCELPAAKVLAQKSTVWFIDESAGAAFWSC